MTNEKNNLTQIFQACWNDASFKKTFVSDPKQILNDHGILVADGIKVTVVENTDDQVYIVLPSNPNQESDLTDDELALTAGGASGIPTMCGQATGRPGEYCMSHNPNECQ